MTSLKKAEAALLKAYVWECILFIHRPQLFMHGARLQSLRKDLESVDAPDDALDARYHGVFTPTGTASVQETFGLQAMDSSIRTGSVAMRMRLLGL